jgi:predicted MFS family arabinose efflux permease
MHDHENVSRHSVSAIATRNFVLAFLAFFTFLVSYFALMPTLPLYFARLGSDAGDIGVLVGIYSVSSLVARLLAGGALSRYSEKSVMVFAALLFAVSFLACIVLRPFWPFFVLRLFQGVMYACFDTAAFSFIVKVTPLAYRSRALGYWMLAPGLATVIAASFGMFLVNEFGFTILFLFCMGLSLCSFLLATTSKGHEVLPEEGTAVPTSLFLEAKIIVPGISVLFYNFVLGSVTAFFSLYAIECGMKNPGYFFSASAIMTIAGRALGGRIVDSWRKEKIILTFTLTSLVAMVILSLSRTVPMFLFVGLLWGAGAAFIFPVSMAYAFDYAGSSGGTAVGTFRALMDLGYAAGPIMIGMIIPLTGYPIMFLCLAVVLLINVCYFQFYVTKRRR